MTIMIFVIVLAFCGAAFAIRRISLHRRHARADQRETQARALGHSWR